MEDYNKKVLENIRDKLSEVKTVSLAEYVSELEKELKNQTVYCEVFELTTIPNKEQ